MALDISPASRLYALLKDANLPVVSVAPRRTRAVMPPELPWGIVYESGATADQVAAAETIAWAFDPALPPADAYKLRIANGAWSTVVAATVYTALKGRLGRDPTPLERAQEKDKWVLEYAGLL